VASRTANAAAESGDVGLFFAGAHEWWTPSLNCGPYGRLEAQLTGRAAYLYVASAEASEISFER
jgi:hypothetical protein